MRAAAAVALLGVVETFLLALTQGVGAIAPFLGRRGVGEGRHGRVVGRRAGTFIPHEGEILLLVLRKQTAVVITEGLIEGLRTVYGTMMLEDSVPNVLLYGY